MTLSAFLKEVLLDTLIDFAKLLPFLFLTYLLMEWLEHRASGKMEASIRRAGKVGPLFGGFLGIVPQCGFSAAASGLYAGRVISLGTLIAVYLSTSDEMLPIMIAEKAPALLIVKLLATKLLLGIFFGFLVDILFRLVHKKEEDHPIHELCEHDGCHCEEGILRSALHHTVHISLFLLLVLFLLKTGIFFLGEDRLAAAFNNIPVLGHLLSALVGLIPNCVSSVLITKLYLEGVLSAGCMLSGLLVGTGVGILVLFRANRSKKEAFFILLLLFGIGALSGMLLDLLGIGAIL